MYEINVKKSNKNSFIVRRVNKNVAIKREQRKIQISAHGKRGIKGDPGRGIPEGGLPGQVLVKTSNESFDTAWSSTAGGDKNYVQYFNGLSFVMVNHNLTKYPAVSVYDSTGDEVEVSVTYLTLDSLRLDFSSPFSGTVTCN